MSTVVPAAEHELLEQGTVVGEYEIDGEIGHGGMGVVYSAVHPIIGKQAAIKVLRREMAENPVAVERFIQEARAVNGIGHANIIDVFAFGNLPDGRPYLMMDLLVGESLRARLKRGPLHVSEAASVLDEVASALTAAHAKGVIHRDLKPDNVFLCARQGRWPEVKLLDFGLAKLIPGINVDRPIRTHTGIMLGTPDYMAPEQVRERSVADPRSDVYALGVMAFESLTGRRPFAAAEGYEAMLAVAQTPAPELGPIAPHLPKDLSYLIDGLLLKDPAQRPSLADVRAALKRLRAVLPTQSVASMEIQLPARPAVDVSLGGLTASRVGASPLLPAATPSQQPLGAPAEIAVPTPRAKALQTAAIAAKRDSSPSVQVQTVPGTLPARRMTPPPMSLSQAELADLPTAIAPPEVDLESTVPQNKFAPIVPGGLRAPSMPMALAGAQLPVISNTIPPANAAIAAMPMASPSSVSVPPAPVPVPAVSTIPPQNSAGIARGPSIMPTQLGVIAPQRNASAPHPALQIAPPPPKRGGTLLLVFGALLAIGAGIALAIAIAS